MSAQIIFFRNNGTEATAISQDCRFVYSQHVPSFMREKLAEREKLDA